MLLLSIPSLRGHWLRTEWEAYEKLHSEACEAARLEGVEVVPHLLEPALFPRSRALIVEGYAVYTCVPASLKEEAPSVRVVVFPAIRDGLFVVGNSSISVSASSHPTRQQ